MKMELYHHRNKFDFKYILRYKTVISQYYHITAFIKISLCEAKILILKKP